ARRLGGRAGRRRGGLGPRRLRSLAGGERREALPLDQGRDLLAVQDLVLQERLGDADQRCAVGLDHLLRPLVRLQTELLDLPVDQNGGRLAVVLVLRDLAAKEDLLFLLSE